MTRSNRSASGSSAGRTPASATRRAAILRSQAFGHRFDGPDGLCLGPGALREPQSLKSVGSDFPVDVEQCVMRAARAEAAGAAAFTTGRRRNRSREFAGTLVEAVRRAPPDRMREIGAGGELVPTSKAPSSRAVHYQEQFATQTTLPSRQVSECWSWRSTPARSKRGWTSPTASAPELASRRCWLDQLAAVHRSTMKLADQVTRRLNGLQGLPVESATAQRVSVEAARLAGVMTRMTAAFQQGMLTLRRFRTGGQQQVLVQHHYLTNVEDGGQAIVAVGHQRRPPQREGGGG